MLRHISPIASEEAFSEALDYLLLTGFDHDESLIFGSLDKSFKETPENIGISAMTSMVPFLQ